MKNLFYALTFFSFVTACSDNSVQNPTPPPVSDNGDNNNMQVVEFLRNRAMVASYNTIFPNKETERIERKGVLLSWRWLSTDPDDIGFDIYRKEGNYKFQKLNKTPIINSSNYKDLTANINKILKYEVRQANTNNILCSCNFTPEMAQNFYRTVPLNNNNLPYPDLVYKASDAAIGDLDGDGDYELVLKREVSPLDNGSTGIGITPGSCLLEAYKLTAGTFLWRIDLGSNIRQGIHYTPFIVYDLNGDGKAEIAVRTSEGTVFGDGTKIGDVNQDGITDYVDRAPQSATYGRIITGPEFLSIIEGRTGKEVARTDYIYRGEKNKWVTYWGDNWANRMDRFLMGVGHFRSQKGIPSLLMCRGYYKNYQIVALDFTDNKITERWHFDTADNYSDYIGQGNHNLAVGDIDDDGKDEVLYGACVIDHNGKGLYSTKLGHGDAMHLGKFDPTQEGYQVVVCHEEPKEYGNIGTEFRDARTGRILHYIPGNGKDVGRCMVADVDPDSPGCEYWSSEPDGVMYSCKGNELTGKRAPIAKGGDTSYNMTIWWSGSLNRQMLDYLVIHSYTDGRLFNGSDWGVKTASGTKNNACFYGDIWGDWREEVIFVDENDTELRIFTTDFETDYRFHPLMDDHLYRLSATHQNIGYNQPTHPGYYIGSDLNK